ncbi:MAG: gluconate 2-dehydrogenase subunit 3 family protein [Bacteroidota bacterium]
MKRRQAIQNIALLSAGFALLPACNFEQWPELDNIPLEPDHKKLMTWLTETILPTKGEPVIVTPEPAAHFVLTMVDDCFETEDLQEYVEGMNGFLQALITADKASVQDLKPEESYSLLMSFVEDDSIPKAQRFFIQKTKQLTVRHFTSSEYFMKNHLRFEFVPGRFNGCVQV